MPKRMTNNLRWQGELLKLGEKRDPITKRVTMDYPFQRLIKYENIGITATDKFTTKDENEIVKKVKVRIDRELEENPKDYRIKIKSRIYKVERIFVIEDEHKMEVSLSYDN